MARDTSASASDGGRSYVVVALDVGATRIKAALVAPDGSRRAELRRRTARADGPDAVLRQIADVAAEIAALGAGLDLPACGIAVPGTVDPAGLVTSVNLGWKQVNVADLISARLDIPVAVVNDAHAGAIGEGDFGAALGVRDYLYVSLGTGIGAAIVQDGSVLAGAHGHAGELGHIRVDYPGRPCACGSRGCLETKVSAAALETRWREIHGAARPAREIIDLVIARDPAAEALWDEAIAALAVGLLTVMSLIDPAIIVLGGGLAGAGDRLVQPLGRRISDEAQSFHSSAELRLASLGDWSGCAGAAAEARALKG
jgi:glucokinase